MKVYRVETMDMGIFSGTMVSVEDTILVITVVLLHGMITLS